MRYALRARRAVLSSQCRFLKIEVASGMAIVHSVNCSKRLPRKKNQMLKSIKIVSSDKVADGIAATHYSGLTADQALCMELRCHPATTDSRVCGFAQWCEQAAKR